MNGMIEWAKAHPRLTAWIALALGMDGLVAYEARTVGLQPMQWLALIGVTTLVAGLCVWIIGWEDEEDEGAQAAPAASTAPVAPAAPPAKATRKPPARKPAAKKPASRKKAKR